MMYTRIMSILVNLGGWCFIFIQNQPSAMICFCSSIILCALIEIQKENQAKMEAIEKKIIG